MNESLDFGDDTDPVSAWIRAHPEAWGDAVEPLGQGEVDALIDRVVSRSRTSQARRRRNVTAVSAVAAIVVAGGAAGVAAMLRGQPSEPTAGVACMDAVGDDAVIVAINATDDPIAGCEAAWRAGQFDDDRDHPPEPPVLVACLGTGGAIQVHPLEFGTCAALGLDAADPTLDDSSLAIVGLDDRIVAEVNAAEPCLTAPDAAATAGRIIDDVGLSGWRVQIAPGSARAECAKAAVETDRRVVTIRSFP
jgi:hypothetical protein